MQEKGDAMQKENREFVELLPKVVKEYFLDSIDERLHEYANQHLHAIEVAANELLGHHLDFEMDRIDAQMSNNPVKEEERLSIIYAYHHDFGLAKKSFKDAEKELLKLNPKTAQQVVLHIAEMVNKKHIEIKATNSFMSSISVPKHIH